MKWEKMEIVGVTVQDFERAVADFTDLFDVEFLVYDFPHDVDFEELPVEAKLGPANLDLTKRNRVAIDTRGFWELIEVHEGQTGIRNVHFKVDDIEAAKEELTAKGLTLVADYRLAGLRESVFHGDKLRGVRLCILEYDGDSAVREILAR